MNHSFDHSPLSSPLPRVRKVGLSRPLVWIRAGWLDLRANPLPSLAYGLLFALAGDLIILAALNRPHLLTVAISGFFLIAPLLAAGLYELSRALAKDEHLFFIDSLRCFRRNGESLLFLGLILGLISLFWERVSAVAFALVAIDSPTSGAIFLNEIIVSGEHLAFTATWFATGALLALLVFAGTVVSVPLILDRDTDAPTAIATSLRTFIGNVFPLLVWAALIVALTLLGFASLLFGLVLIMPILGHASWHAYRELVE